MLLEKIELFSSKKDFFIFLSIAFILFFYALLMEYHNFKKFSYFDSTTIKADVIKQYKKTNDTKTYQILKLKTQKGFSFYTSAKKDLPSVIGQKVVLKIATTKISFYNYLTTFYAPSKVLSIDQNISFKQKVNLYISQIHPDKKIASLYQALYTATPLSSDLQTKFSTLGVSHLLAISGFHLAVLAGVLFFMFKFPYGYLQQHYFPYRSYRIDSFLFIALVLFGYVLFLDSPPSLVRAFTMMLIGFFLYDRGYKIISMQTLFITTVLLLSIFPRLFFSLGLWLSVLGVFYIFLFLIHFKHINKIWQFILVPFWVYLMMLPFSVYLFENFSIYHPLSVLWSTLFSLFYPLSILLHLLGLGDLFDPILSVFLDLSSSNKMVFLSSFFLSIHLGLSLLSVFYQRAIYFLVIEVFFIFGYCLYCLE